MAATRKSLPPMVLLIGSVNTYRVRMSDPALLSDVPASAIRRSISAPYFGRKVDAPGYLDATTEEDRNNAWQAHKDTVNRHARDMAQAQCDAVLTAHMQGTADVRVIVSMSAFEFDATADVYPECGAPTEYAAFVDAMSDAPGVVVFTGKTRVNTSVPESQGPMPF